MRSRPSAAPADPATTAHSTAGTALLLLGGVNVVVGLAIGLLAPAAIGLVLVGVSSRRWRCSARVPHAGQPPNRHEHSA